MQPRKPPLSSEYPGKSEILAAWKWGVSKEHTPITASSEASTAMDLAYRAFVERDAARDALGHLPEENTDLRGQISRLRAECLRALAERDEAIEVFENAHELCDADLEAQKRLTRAALLAPKILATAAALLIALVLVFN